jgi:tetratricopeptide (TPR) repeat protein
MRCAALGICLLLAILPTRAVMAQQIQETAAEAFQRGSIAYERGEYAAAAQAFELAYALSPHAAALFNQARALERAENTARAADAYERALARAELRPQDKADCEARLAALSGTLGSVVITGPPESRASIGSLDQARLPIRAHLTTGRYELALVRKDGVRATLLVGVTAGHVTELRVPERGVPWSDAQPPMAPERARPTRWKIPTSAYLTAGVALSAAGLGTYMGISGLNARDRFDASQHTDQSAHDSAVRSRTTANVAFAVSVAAAITTGFLVYRAASAPIRVSLLPGSSASSAPTLDLSVSGDF